MESQLINAQLLFNFIDFESLLVSENPVVRLTPFDCRADFLKKLTMRCIQMYPHGSQSFKMDTLYTGAEFCSLQFEEVTSAPIFQLINLFLTKYIYKIKNTHFFYAIL